MMNPDEITKQLIGLEDRGFYAARMTLHPEDVALWPLSNLPSFRLCGLAAIGPGKFEWVHNGRHIELCTSPDMIRGRIVFITESIP